MHDANNDTEILSLCEELMAFLEGRNGSLQAGRRGRSQGLEEVSEEDIEALCRLWEEEEAEA